MFHSARIKLTAWYLLIIMTISLSFSVVIYRVVASELGRVERVQRYRIEHGLTDRLRIFPPPDSSGRPPFILLDPDLVAETKSRFLLILVLTNVLILLTSAYAGYFLAGRTLNPIKEMMDEQNRFITDASHELRTPLTSLKSEIEVNLRDKKLNLEDAKKILRSNLEEVNNLQTLSDGLIKLTQYHKSNNHFKFTEISLLQIANKAIKKISNLAKEKNIKLVNQIENQTFEGNKFTLAEMMVIFLDNAIKYSHNNTAITLTSEIINGNLLVHIQDEGQGINEKDLPYLFDRFYRADKSRTKTDTYGYGLGLSIAKEIVDRHHGIISFNSKVDSGTIVTVQLPIKQPIQNI